MFETMRISWRGCGPLSLSLSFLTACHSQVLIDQPQAPAPVQAVQTVSPRPLVTSRPAASVTPVPAPSIVPASVAPAPALSSLELSPSIITLSFASESASYGVIARDAQGNYLLPEQLGLVWSIDHPEHFSVDQQGRVTPLGGSGFSTVRVYHPASGLRASARINLGNGSSGGGGSRRRRPSGPEPTPSPTPSPTPTPTPSPTPSPSPEFHLIQAAQAPAAARASKLLMRADDGLLRVHDDEDIFLQAFDDAGEAQGATAVANDYTTGSQHSPDLAGSSQGDLVVVWDGAGATGDGIYARLLAEDGSLRGGSFRADTGLTQAQSHAAPSVAMDEAGNFIVVWLAFINGSSDVYGQRFDSEGTPVGTVIEIMTNVSDRPEVAMDADGNFAVTWSQQAGSGDYDVFVRRYTSGGEPKAAATRVNEWTTDYQHGAKIAMDAAGNFVIAWGSQGQDEGDLGIYARRYDSDGMALDPEFLVSGGEVCCENYVLSDTHDLAMNRDGAFALTWSTLSPPSTVAVYASLYDPAGSPVTQATRVSSQITLPLNNTYLAPSIGLDSQLGYGVSWVVRGLPR